MKLIHRRLIYLFFIGLFLSGLPLIFLYANGYRYNFKKHILEKTGIIFLETKPSKVKVFLNGQLVAEKTPLRIKKLLPNEYELKVTKAGYQDWVKTVEIKAEETNFIQYVRLFKADGEINDLYNGNLVSMDYTKTAQLFLLQEKNNQTQKLILVKQNSQQNKTILATQQPITKMELIENGRTALVRSQKQVWLIDTATGKKEELADLLKLNNLQKANLKVNKYNSIYIYFIKNGSLYSYNRFNRQTIKWLDYQPLDYLVADNSLFYLAHNSLNKIFLNQLDFDTQQEQQTILALNPNNNYKLREVHKNYVIIQNEDNKDLILLNRLTQKFLRLKKVTFFKWDNEGNELLYGNQHEIWIFKPREKEKFILLTRTAEKIKQAIWYSVPTHIIYLVGNQIKITENLNNNRQTLNILKLKEIDQLAINQKADKLYFIGQAKTQHGLFELTLQDLND